MLLFSLKRDYSERNQTKFNNEQICTAIQKAWVLSYEIGELGAAQTSTGWGISERACHIADEMLSNTVDDIGADQTANGMSISENAYNLDEQLEFIAKSSGCKLTPRSYG